MTGFHPKSPFCVNILFSCYIFLYCSFAVFVVVVVVVVVFFFFFFNDFCVCLEINCNMACAGSRGLLWECHKMFFCQTQWMIVL